MAKRVYNFSAGPGMLPEAVLKKAADEMLDHQGSGMSVMEMSHRSKVYQSIIDGAEKSLRELMSIPANYKVLFLQGGASMQFAMVPLNLMKKSNKADYVNTGEWATKAIAEAKRYGDIKVVASSEPEVFNHLPALDPKEFRPDADYVHMTTNNTIFGTSWKSFPDTKGVPLVADMSSDILSKVVDVKQFALIYAGAQKNMGPAGVTVVIIRDDMIDFSKPETPTMLKYKTQVDGGSMYNTPPCYGIYIIKLVCEYLLGLGGVAAMEKINNQKAAMVYDAIDNSKLFKCHVQKKEDRSIMNIPFRTASDDLDKKFLKEAEAEGLVSLSGHRKTGGMRASVYNAMPMEGVEKLVAFIKKFDQANS
ncbi:3-phosphoserine/phosphohydroxythreonine transaminase [candidate division TA06 bacterium]|uniref:Phosphoserine aminotransferase n=1 Tax=candidate division TA06 bacterium TaxID=2250710 RepID=A0A933MIS0_UNCT6|nr:3-phosphoserine/phosphohydroxythreonine transaminase [candidate division TA06 bacterium]